MSYLTTHARRALVAALPLAALVTPAAVLAGSAPPASAPPAPFVELLAMMPAGAVSDPSAVITYTDMNLLWERIGATDGVSRLDSLRELAAPATFSLLPQLFDNRFAMVDESVAEVGFDFTQIDRELAVIAPPRRILIDVTSVSPTTIDAAIESNPMWADRLTRVETDHGSYVDWGDGTGLDPAAISPFRPLGQGGQLAVLGDPATTVRTMMAADAEAVLASAAGAGESALTTDLLGPIADVLGDDVVMQALILPGPVPFAPPLTGSADQIATAIEQAVLVLPYVGIGIVEVADGDASRIEVLLVHTDEETASANVAMVEAALAEGVDPNTQVPLSDTFPNASVTAEGVVVRVDVSGEGAFVDVYQRLVNRALFPS